jgi:tripeptidyl-peptidase-1
MCGPFVTSVGGTKPTASNFVEEVANRISGGGFSAYFSRGDNQADYQDKEVTNFLNQLDSRYEGLYNPAGRGVPDIAMLSSLYRIVSKESRGISAQVIDTMSSMTCSATTAAGIFSLLNDYRLSNGEAPLGFLNPMLYGIGWLGIKDITSGSSRGCTGATAGFSAIQGWDPVRPPRPLSLRF